MEPRPQVKLAEVSTISHFPEQLFWQRQSIVVNWGSIIEGPIVHAKPVIGPLTISILLRWKSSVRSILGLMNSSDHPPVS
jgi:hypothetical protein